jgi:hypothetical protein
MAVKLEDVHLYREGRLILKKGNWQIDKGDHWVFLQVFQYKLSENFQKTDIT